MLLLQRIKTGIPEFGEQAAIVSDNYGGSKFRWILSMAWCLVRYGARPIDYVRFEFHKKSAHERNRYLTIYRYFHLLKKFGYREASVYGKIAEYQTFKNFIRRDWMCVTKETDSVSVHEFINKHGVVFAKPNHGDQGHGVEKIVASDATAIDRLLAACKTEQYVIEEQLHNIDEIARINPSSLNTVRAYTLYKYNGESTILAVMLRVGRNGSHVDNWGSGGIGYNFDVETGVCLNYGRDKKNKPFIFHPDTNIQMVGYQLPQYEKLKEYILQLSQVTPEARFVGWDIAITPKGFDLVEMNCPGGHDFLQAFGEPFGDILKKGLS